MKMSCWVKDTILALVLWFEYLQSNYYIYYNLQYCIKINFEIHCIMIYYIIIYCYINYFLITYETDEVFLSMSFLSHVLIWLFNFCCIYIVQILVGIFILNFSLVSLYIGCIKIIIQTFKSYYIFLWFT